MPDVQDQGNPLEDRLRNLILSNTDDIAPKDLRNSSATPILGQDGNSDTATSAANKAARKRPNQAQRRQMNSQMTLDIDVRATAPQHPRPLGNQSDFNRSTGPGHHTGPSHSHGQRGGPHGHRGHHGHHGHHNHHGRHGQHDHDGQQHHPHHSHRESSSISVASPTNPEEQQNWRPNHHHHHQQHHHHHPRGGHFGRGAGLMQSDTFISRPPRNTSGSLYRPEGHRQYVVKPEELTVQSELLARLCAAVVENAEIEHNEILQKENFRKHVEHICRHVVSNYEINANGARWFQPQSVQLACFGSLASGFATKTADMDLGLLSPSSSIPPSSPESPIPRLIEKALLDAGFGARLLTRTRVPIIKLCEQPTPKLHTDLVNERVKWEQDITEDGPEPLDNTAAATEAEKDAVADSPESTKIGVSSVIQQEADLKVDPHGAKDMSSRSLLASLKQAPNQDLTAYHNQAKKLLRQLGGRDVTHSNQAVFSEADFLLLDDVSNAFVEGLYDQPLKRRIQLYSSFSMGRHAPNRRTLHGVCNMVEGEKLVMLWENRAVPKGDPRVEQASIKTVQWWADLHNTRSFGLDPLSFNREMFMLLERLRGIPSIQLMQLQQDQSESPAEYHSRAVKILTQLSAVEFETPDAGTYSPAIQHYVSGIEDKNIRNACEQFVRTTDTKNLLAVARRHKTLHLANEYEQALEKGGLYQEQDVSFIRKYVELLRGDLALVSTEHGDDYRLLIPDEMIGLDHRISELPNPAQLASNHPKNRYYDRLEFPQSGIGVQCDINFSAHLALQNSHLLRCYAATDPRVRPMVLFIKHWAKARDINTPYRGTLSSYGYVLMVLHYLVNIVQPFMCPNLQILAPPDPDLPPEELEGITTCNGRNVRFWRNEEEIQRLSQEGVLNANKDSVGYLLRGFFEYYAQNNMMSTIQKRGFDWGRDVISLRTPGGILSKQEKNWVQAKTVMQTQMGAPPTPTSQDLQSNAMGPAYQTTQPDAPSADISVSPDVASKLDPTSKPQELKEVRHRYLFAIEDPFEHEHNVARTVTHNGIVSIRDEFRRAWRLIKAAGKGTGQEELLENNKIRAELLERKQFADLLAEIHGTVNRSE